VRNDGKMYAENATIKLKAKSMIGTWKVEEERLSNYLYSTPLNNETPPAYRYFTFLRAVSDWSNVSDAVFGVYYDALNPGFTKWEGSSTYTRNRFFCVTNDGKVYINKEGSVIGKCEINENGELEIPSNHIFTNATPTDFAIDASINENYETLFDDLALQTYTYNGQYHIGFDASKLKTDYTEFNYAGFAKKEIDEGETTITQYKINYNEFIALNTWQIQKLKAKVKALEDRIASLESGTSEPEA
jgi:hypothetical protein